MEKGACYLLFKNFESPAVYSENDVDLEMLCQAIQKLHMLPVAKSKSVNQLEFTSWKQDGITKEYYMCSLQNLLFFYPGCITADECGNRLFLSDCNHHRIIVSDGNGMILDCIGSSPGFEDGDFEFAKLRRPAGSYYHAAEDCLYFIDSENLAIRKADMEARSVETLYPTNASNKNNGCIWKWILNKLGLESIVDNDVDEILSDVFDSRTPYLPWHMLKSVDDTIFILDRRFQTVWIMDLASAKIDKVVQGSSEIHEICRKQITKKLSLLDHVAYDGFQHQIEYSCPVEGLPYYGFLSSLTTLQDQIFICDTVGHRILRVDRESGVCSNLQFSNLGILGLPYWMAPPLETFYATRNGFSDVPIDHLQCFQLLPGRILIQLTVDIPEDTELVQPLDEACIWRQARGAATEVSVIEDVPGSVEKVGVAQQWYDELDVLASPKPETEVVPEDNPNNNLVGEDKKKCFTCNVNTSPGTSEVIIYTMLYLKLKRNSNSREAHPDVYAGRILDLMSSGRYVKMERDLWCEFLSKSKVDLRDIIFMKPLHIRIKFESYDHPKADNGRDIILTDSCIEVKVSVN